MLCWSWAPTRERLAPSTASGSECPMRLQNPATGEVIDVLSESPELLVMRSTWTRPGHRAVAHTHPKIQERFEILEGVATFEIDGVTSQLGPGSNIVAEPGQRHLAWNATDERVVLLIEMRPPLRWTHFVRRLFAGEAAVPLLAEFSPEIRLG